MEVADEDVYPRDKRIVIILLHPKLIFRFTNAEEGQVQDLEDVRCVRSENDSIDMAFAWKSEDLTGDI
jgi:hypothetical protein